MFEQFENFINKRWQIDCPQIKIFDKNTKISTSGTIYQDQEGKLKLKAYSPSSNIGEQLFKNLPQPGVLLDRRYHIVAKEYSGSKWHSDVFWLTANIGKNGSILKADIDTISKSTTTPSANLNYLSIVVSPVGDFPARSGKRQKQLKAGRYFLSYSRNEANFNIRNLKFEMIKDGKIVRVNCYPRDNKLNNEITPALQWRILESLQLLLGRRLQILIVERYNSKKEITELHSIRDKKHDQIMPPLRLHDVAIHKDYWKLFKCYFLKCVEEKGSHFHKLSQYLNSVLDSGKASLEGQCLTLAVAIEGLVNHFFNGVKVKKGFTENEIKLVKDKILELPLSDEQKNRIDKLIDLLNQERAKDKLQKLHSLGLIEDDLVKSWWEVRNKAAHGYYECTKIQKCLYHKNSMTELLYKLIFLIIGYTGKYTKYSEVGYPDVTFNQKLK